MNPFYIVYKFHTNVTDYFQVTGPFDSRVIAKHYDHLVHRHVVEKITTRFPSGITSEVTSNCPTGEYVKFSDPRKELLEQALRDIGI